MPHPSKSLSLNRRVLSLTPSATLAITAKTKQLIQQGVDITNFAAGEPDFDTPDMFKEAAIRALKGGATKYTPEAGTPALREAVAEKLKRDNGLTYKPEQIIVTVGAKHALYNALQVLVEEGDEVLIPAPYWLSYPEMVKMAGGRSVFIPATEKQGFKITPEQLKQSITPASKVLIMNSPSNPTGVVYTRQELYDIAKVAIGHGLVIVSDEIYEALVYRGAEHHAIAALDPSFYDSVVTVNGFSKAYAMTGWRLGYLAAPLEIAKAASSLQSHQTSNVTSFIQPAAIEALRKGGEEVKKMHDIFSRRRDLVVKLLRTVPKISFVEPEGAFYVFLNIAETGLSSLEFAGRLLEEAHVAVVPGAPFGADHHVRISFAASEPEIEKGVERMRRWIDSRK